MKHLKTTVVLTALSAVFLLGQSCQKTNRYSISGNFKSSEWDGGKAYIAHVAGNDWLFSDSAEISHGKFVLKGIQDTAICKTLILKKELQQKITPVILEKGNVLVSIGETIALSGTPMNNTLQQFLDIEAKFNPLFNEIVRQWSLEQNETKKMEIEQNYLKTENEYRKSALDFLSKNLENVAGSYAFLQIYPLMEEEEQVQMLEKTGRGFQYQPEIQRLMNRLESVKKIAPGKHFVDLEMQNTEGETVHLSDFVGKGKYVVIDFWASWCGPCRKAMPQLKLIYDEYHKKEVLFIGISLDDQREVWIESIKELELPWIQLSDLKGWESAANSVYGVNSIPHLMLLDKTGVILAKNLDDEALLKKLKEEVR